MELKAIYTLVQQCLKENAHPTPHQHEHLTQVPHVISSLIRSQTRHIAQSVTSGIQIRKVNKHTFTVLNTRISLYIYQGRNIKRLDIRKTVFLISLYIRLCEKFTHRDHISLHLIPSVYKKTIDRNQVRVIDANNVNSGMTDYTDDFIVVYRHEELFKVLLHELIHYYKFDFYEYDTTASKYADALKQLYRIESSKIGLNEAHTEMLTQLIFMAIYTLLNDRPSYAHYVKNLDTLRMYSVSRMRLLYQLFTRHHGGVIKENTHVFSYFFAKTLLLCQLPRYLNLLKDKLTIQNDTEIEELVSLVTSAKPIFDKICHQGSQKFRKQESLRMIHVDLPLEKLI